MIHTETQQQAPTFADLKATMEDIAALVPPLPGDENPEYDAFLVAIRANMQGGQCDQLDVNPEYQYDSSALSAGPRTATALTSLYASVRVTFGVPVAKCPKGYVLNFTHGNGLMCCGPLDYDDPRDVLADVIEGQEGILTNIIWEQMSRKFAFATKAGLASLKPYLTVSDWEVYVAPLNGRTNRLAVRMTIRFAAD